MGIFTGNRFININQKQRSQSKELKGAAHNTLSKTFVMFQLGMSISEYRILRNRFLF